MVGNDIGVIRQMSLFVVVHENYGVSDSSQQGKTWKLWCFWLRLCTLIIFARAQQSDPWCYLNHYNKALCYLTSNSNYVNQHNNSLEAYL